MSLHTYAIEAAGSTLIDVTVHALVKEAAAQFPDHTVQAGLAGDGVNLDVTPDLDGAQTTALDALVAAHKARHVAHLYVRAADDVDLRELGREVMVALPGIAARIHASATDLRVLVDSAPLDAAQTTTLDAAVAAHRGGTAPLARLRRRKVERVRARTLELLEQGFDFEGTVYPLSDYIGHATSPHRFVSIDGTATVRLADDARLALFAAAASAAERAIRNGEANIIQAILDAVDGPAVQAVPDNRSAP
jgi:hypothetical protein